MHRISIIVVIFLFSVCIRCDDESIFEGSELTNDPTLFTLEIPEYVIIERQNATDYIEIDNVKQHVMGISDDKCDNASYNLFVDFDPTNLGEININTKCSDNSLYPVDRNLQPLMTMLEVPRRYFPIHRCMKTYIQYSERIPLIGPHRPLWAKYGEFAYVPPQRWLHNIEHGGIVLLYHPCADLEEVKLFKNLVKKCLFRHVITPYLSLTKERPIALLGWSASIEFSSYDLELSRNFIRYYAKSGPEKLFRDGQYKHLLIENATIVSDRIDSTICPGM